jgi:hypothetical protein
MGTVDYQGFPQRYALTETANTDTSDLEPGDFADDDWPLNEKGAGPSDSGDDSSLKAGPGEMMLLRGFKQVGQFDAAQPGVFLDPIMFNVRAMAQITDTPLRMFDPQSSQRSGESFRRRTAPSSARSRTGRPPTAPPCTRRSCSPCAASASRPGRHRRLGARPVRVDAEGWQTVEAKIGPECRAARP